MCNGLMMGPDSEGSGQNKRGRYWNTEENMRLKEVINWRVSQL